MSPALLFLRYLCHISAGSTELFCHWPPDMALCVAAVLAVWLSGNALVSTSVGRHSYSTLGSVSAWMGDCLRARELSRYVTGSDILVTITKMIVSS